MAASVVGLKQEARLPMRAHLSWHKRPKLTADLYFTILDDFCFSSQLQYTASGKENLQNYNLVTDTPLYVTAVQSGINASEVRLSCLFS